MLPKTPSVIAVENDRCVLRQAQRLQLVQHTAQLTVHPRCRGRGAKGSAQSRVAVVVEKNCMHTTSHLTYSSSVKQAPLLGDLPMRRCVGCGLGSGVLVRNGWRGSIMAWKYIMGGWVIACVGWRKNAN